MLLKLRLALFPLWMVAFTCVASATAIYNNLDSPTFFFDGVCTFPGISPACFGPLADSFSSDPAGDVLNRVGILLKSNSSGGGQITVELTSDHGGMPGTSLLQLGTVADTQLTSAYTSFFFPARFRLAPSTRYWIELSDSSASGVETSADWAFCLASCQAALGVPGEFFANEGDTASGWRVFPNTFGPYQMEVDAAINPEPASFLLLAGGLLTLGLLASRSPAPTPTK